MKATAFVLAALMGITYQINIKPILDAHCVECHHAGGRGPDFSRFPFASSTTTDQYEIVKRILLKADPASGSMPPGVRTKFSSFEIQMFNYWRDQGLRP